MPKKTFTQTLDQLRYGTLTDELTDALHQLTADCTDTGRSGKLTITLQLKPGKGGQVEVFDEIKVTPPKRERASSIMFATPEGNLQREDPRQKQIEGLRSVDDHKPAELRNVG